jgi:hypothetical protein
VSTFRTSPKVNQSGHAAPYRLLTRSRLSPGDLDLAASRRVAIPHRSADANLPGASAALTDAGSCLTSGVVNTAAFPRHSRPEPRQTQPEPCLAQPGARLARTGRTVGIPALGHRVAAVAIRSRGSPPVACRALQAPQHAELQAHRAPRAPHRGRRAAPVRNCSAWCTTSAEYLPCGPATSGPIPVRG